jgi:hypothetical protein
VSLTRVAAQNGGPVYAHKPVFGALVLFPDPLAGQLSLGRVGLGLAFQRRFSGVPACPDVMYADQLHEMSSINLSDSLSLPNGAEVGEGSKFVVNVADTGVVALSASCQPVTYTNFGFAGIDFPDGYTPASGNLHDLETFAPTASACAPPPPSGGGGGGSGGGGGCAITSPSSTAQPPAVRPRLISRQ